MYWLVALLVSVVLGGCSRADHEPKTGEYGQTLVNSIQLSSQQIDAINKSPMPQIKDVFSRPNIAIDFQPVRKILTVL